MFLLLKFADWLQGPFFYSVYREAVESAGLGEGAEGARYYVALLQLVGFVSGAVFGTVAGGFADWIGRRRASCVCALTAALSCASVAAGAGSWAAIALTVTGRIAGGIASSLQHSTLEAWLYSAAKESKQSLVVAPADTTDGSPTSKRSVDAAEAWVNRIFSLQTFLDGVGAVLAGVVAEYAATTAFGVRGPYYLAAAILTAALVSVPLLWAEENYGAGQDGSAGGDSSGGVIGNVRKALSISLSDRAVGWQGLAQALFDGCMFCFVMTWAPSITTAVKAVDGDAADAVPYGLMFSAFMASTMLGSSILGVFLNLKVRVERVMTCMILIAAGCLAVPAVLTDSPLLVGGAFLVFEICCGISFPGFGAMRSKVIPEELRASISAMYRVPLNVLVVAVLSIVDRIGDDGAMGLCSFVLVIAAVAQALAGSALSARMRERAKSK